MPVAAAPVMVSSSAAEQRASGVLLTVAGLAVVMAQSLSVLHWAAVCDSAWKHHWQWFIAHVWCVTHWNVCLSSPAGCPSL